MKKEFYKNMIKSCKAEIKITKECIKHLEKINPNHSYIPHYKKDIEDLKQYTQEMKLKLKGAI